MTIIRDIDNHKAYKLFGDILLETPLYNDNTIDEQLWSSVEINYTAYQLDIIKKLKAINHIIYATNKGIFDDF